MELCLDGLNKTLRPNVHRIISSISYKEGWRLTFQHLGSNSFQVIILMPVMDISDKTPTVIYHQSRGIPYTSSEHLIVNEIYNTIKEMELHELDEQFEYNNIRIKDPHVVGEENNLWMQATLFKEVNIFDMSAVKTKIRQGL